MAIKFRRVAQQAFLIGVFDESRQGHSYVPQQTPA
jgi:hypothetical protein